MVPRAGFLLGQQFTSSVVGWIEYIVIFASRFALLRDVRICQCCYLVVVKWYGHVDEKMFRNWSAATLKLGNYCNLSVQYVHIEVQILSVRNDFTSASQECSAALWRSDMQCRAFSGPQETVWHSERSSQQLLKWISYFVSFVSVLILCFLLHSWDLVGLTSEGSLAQRQRVFC